ncbi:hypothetical protein WL21_04785 [Burkholderia ubonensis]|uniref:FliH/SctL family protein n=1 Tax=Burkholderia ubonensis TaxID=101571 RepID=UPI0007521FF5|nr:FliH/SctL family protein [Burkholderia ubonensis]KVO87699.1 hypothetical protein WJ81_15755 [Burkholderia ubonensis]KVZ57316.1 hypothetical protein WL20_23540 [Burkholderia ubonensis]KVZ73013.1 hypothetical protein WL21_04785 [Burkholderia ubonensis]
MRTYRPYAFPSLARVQAARAGAAVNAGAAAGVPGADGFGAAPSPLLLDEARQDGYRQGYEAGLEAGAHTGADDARREARDALDALCEPVDALIAGFQAVQRDERNALRGELALLVEKVARQVIRSELDTRPEQVLAFVDEALASLPQAPDAVEVRVNADEYRRIEAATPEHAQRWQLVPDARLAPGECRVRAGEREIDAGCGQRLAACLERIAASLAQPGGGTGDGDPA